RVVCEDDGEAPEGRLPDGEAGVAEEADERGTRVAAAVLVIVVRLRPETLQGRHGRHHSSAPPYHPPDLPGRAAVVVEVLERLPRRHPVEGARPEAQHG